MHIICALLTLIAGYLLLVYASKQQAFHKTVGTLIAWIVMICAVISFACAIYSYKKYGWHFGHRYHKCYHKKHHKYHEEHGKQPEKEQQPEETEKH